MVEKDNCINCKNEINKGECFCSEQCETIASLGSEVISTKNLLGSCEQMLEEFEKTHSYCNCCGIVFGKDEADGCCPFCILGEDYTWEHKELSVLTKRRNKLNREISTLKKATLNQ